MEGGCIRCAKREEGGAGLGGLVTSHENTSSTKEGADDVLNGTVQRADPVVRAENKQAVESYEPAVMRKRKSEAMDSLVGEIISTTAVRAEKAPPMMNSIDPVPNSAVNFEPVSAMTSTAHPPRPVVKAKQTILEASVSDLSEDIRPRGPEPESQRKPSMLHSSRAISFAAAQPPRLHSASVSSAPDLILVPPLPAIAATVPTRIQTIPSTSSNFFAGLRFSHDIAEQCEGLENALVTHGGLLIAERERLKGAAVDFVIVRLCVNFFRLDVHVLARRRALCRSPFRPQYSQ